METVTTVCDECGGDILDPDLDICDVCEPYNELDQEINRLLIEGNRADAEYLANGG